MRGKMQNISSAWLYPIIIAAGALQAWGPPMNGAQCVRQSLARQPDLRRPSRLHLLFPAATATDL
jgi:hypothetical protein